MKWSIEDLQYTDEIKKITRSTKGIKFENKILTKDSSFEDLLQYINFCYRRPFPGKELKGSEDIHRKYHDGFHIAKALLIQELLIYWILSSEYRQLFSDLYHSLIEMQSDGEQFKLIQLALAYHDKMNREEIDNKDEKAQYLNFIEEMLTLGFDLKTISPFAMAILNKNIACTAENITIFKILLADPDSVEIMRILEWDEKFLLEKLYIFAYVQYRLSSYPKGEIQKQAQNFLTELSIFLSDYRILSHFLKWSNKWQLGYRLQYTSVMSKNVRLATENAILEAQEIIFKFKNYFTQNSLTIPSVPSTPKLTIPQLLIPSKTHYFLELRDESLKKSSTRITVDPVITLFQERKLLLRLFLFNKLSKDKILSSDSKVLESESVPKALKIDNLEIPSFDWNSESAPESKVTESKNVASAMLILPNTTVRITFSNVLTGILISSGHLIFEGVYKKNLYYRLMEEKGLFFHDQTLGGTKDIKDLSHLHKKTDEISARLNGMMLDSRLKYYGKNYQLSNEVLISTDSFPKKNVVGICVLKSKLPHSAVAALGISFEIRDYLNRKKILPFYEYDEYEGSLVRRSLSEILSWVRWLHPENLQPELKTSVVMNTQGQKVYDEIIEAIKHGAFTSTVHSSLEKKEEKLRYPIALSFDYDSKKVKFSGQCQAVNQGKNIIKFLTPEGATLLEPVPDLKCLNFMLMQCFIEQQLEIFYSLSNQRSCPLKIIHSEYCEAKNPVYINVYFPYFYFAIWLSFNSLQDAELAKKEVLPQWLAEENKLFPPTVDVSCWIMRIEIRYLQVLHYLNKWIEKQSQKTAPLQVTKRTRKQIDFNSNPRLLIYYGSVNVLYAKSQVLDKFFHHQTQIPRLTSQKERWESLLVATQQGNLNQIKSLVVLLNHFNSIELCPGGNHPLILAASQGLVRILKILLFHDQYAHEDNQLLFHPNQEGLTAYDTAKKAGHTVCAGLIKQVMDKNEGKSGLLLFNLPAFAPSQQKPKSTSSFSTFTLDLPSLDIPF